VICVEVNDEISEATPVYIEIRHNGRGSVPRLSVIDDGLNRLDEVVVMDVSAVGVTNADEEVLPVLVFSAPPRRRGQPRPRPI